MNRDEILRAALDARDNEILEYQINIDNFRLAIEKISEEHQGHSEIDLAMRDFSTSLQALLVESSIEQKKAQIIRSVIKAQLREASC